jgi:hypothetical protein
LTYLYDKGESTNEDKSNLSFETPREDQPTVATEMPIVKQDESADNDKVSWGETIVKSVGSLATRFGRKLFDWAMLDASNSVYIDPKTGEATRLKSIDELVEDNHYSIQMSRDMKETADRLAKEADPTRGEQGYGELLMDMKLGKMVQKGLGDAIQSLDATAMGNNYLTMVPYVLGTAASNYIDEAVENPNVPAWKRGVYALGTAAFEQFVEKFENPFAGKKVVGEITEGAAIDLIRRGTKEGVKAVADRIFKVLKRVGKGAGGEGFEEVVTSFGTDLIGEALDAIDGDKDYGISAQWEKEQKNNPDANLWDFAYGKAQEYFDAFLGGAVSGVWMSGPTTAVREVASAIEDSDFRSRMDSYRGLGEELGYSSMYDTDEKVKVAECE